MQSGAIQFIETLDRTSLTVGDNEFEKNVEAAVSAIAERNREAEAEPPSHTLVAEKSAPGAPEVTPRNSLEGELYHRRKDGPISSDEDNAAVTGLLRTIQKPLSTIGRIFSDESESPAERPMQQATPPQQPSSPRPSPGTFPPMRNGGEERRDRSRIGVQQRENTALDAQEAAARQASAEAAEARRIQRAEHNDLTEYVSNNSAPSNAC